MNKLMTRQAKRIAMESPIRVYVANLGKYNEGFLVGEWLNLPASEDEMQEMFCRIKLGTMVDGEYSHGYAEGFSFYEEYAIHDYECDIDGVSIGEYSSLDSLNEQAERISELLPCDIDLIGAIVRNYGYSVDEAIEKFEDIHYFQLDQQIYSDEENLAYAYIDECFGNVSNLCRETLEEYFDYHSFGYDLGFDIEYLLEDYSAEEREEICNMSNLEMGEWYIDLIGGIEQLDNTTLERYFDYESFGHGLLFDYTVDRETMLATFDCH